LGTTFVLATYTELRRIKPPFETIIIRSNAMNNSKPVCPEKPQNSNCPVDDIGTLALAMMYVPVQEWTSVYDKETALERGTIFPCLDKPFIGERAVSK